MDYEKKYNEALERAKYYHDRDNIQFLENIFHELKESEDGDIINHLLAICAGAKRYRQFAGCSQDDITKYQTWLESLKDRVQPQTTWKPSDEQIEALKEATNIVGSKYKSCLASLYQELKKLREE